MASLKTICLSRIVIVDRRNVVIARARVCVCEREGSPCDQNKQNGNFSKMKTIIIPNISFLVQTYICIALTASLDWDLAHSRRLAVAACLLLSLVDVDVDVDQFVLIDSMMINFKFFFSSFSLFSLSLFRSVFLSFWFSLVCVRCVSKRKRLFFPMTTTTPKAKQSKKKTWKKTKPNLFPVFVDAAGAAAIANGNDDDDAVEFSTQRIHFINIRITRNFLLIQSHTNAPIHRNTHGNAHHTSKAHDSTP